MRICLQTKRTLNVKSASKNQVKYPLHTNLIYINKITFKFEPAQLSQIKIRNSTNRQRDELIPYLFEGLSENFTRSLRGRSYLLGLQLYCS